MRRLASVLLATALGAGLVATGATAARAATSCVATTATIVVPLTAAKDSAAIAHASYAAAHGYPRVMVWNPVGADQRRAALLKTIPTKAGYDRDEYPPAAGRAVTNADVRYIPSSQNRSAGATLGNTMRRYCAGTRFAYAGVPASAVVTPAPAPTEAPAPGPVPTKTTAPVLTPTRFPDIDPHAGQCYVNGYYRKNGTHVEGYWRRCS